ncbi:MAG: pyrimidine-nucleoside phosphorylase, partial [Acidobacteria bacterium]|nr:pyrimidine-nucleoside phosphorylase [Acidobacteriota bacterium]
VRTGEKFGVRTEAVISDMGQPLGKYVGNALETFECIKILRGEADENMAATVELSLELMARLLALAGAAADVDAAREMAVSKLDSGEALERSRSNIRFQGGDPSVCDHPERLLQNGLTEVAIKAVSAGYISEIDTFAVGNAIVAIGGGRTRAEDVIDHAVGYESLAAIGDSISEGDVLGILYCRNDDGTAAEQLRRAYTISERPVAAPELIKAVV